MTLDECRNATAHLAFTDTLDDLDGTAERSFYTALERALWSVDALRPYTGAVILSHRAPFPAATGEETADSAYVGYALSDLAADAVSLIGAPARLTGERYLPMNGGYLIWNNGREFSLPRAQEGEYRLLYRIRVPQIDSDTPGDTPLLRDEELCQLLPLLVAHYLLLDDDPDKAQRYLIMYREQYALLHGKRGAAVPAEYISVNDW